MHPKVSQGRLILQRHDGHGGLSETSTDFTSLEHLFALCLAATGPKTIDRLVLSGQNEQGEGRTVTFRFQMMTVTSDLSVTVEPSEAP